MGYVEHAPCDALENRDVECKKYEEYEMREILDYALPKTYSDKLFSVDWNIYEKSFKETVDKLVTIKPEIKAERAKEKENKELKDKVYGTKGTKRYSSRKPVQLMEIQARLHAKFAARFTKVNAGSRMVAAAETLVATAEAATTLRSTKSS